MATSPSPIVCFKRSRYLFCNRYRGKVLRQMFMMEYVYEEVYKSNWRDGFSKNLEQQTSVHPRRRAVIDGSTGMRGLPVVRPEEQCNNRLKYGTAFFVCLRGTNHCLHERSLRTPGNTRLVCDCEGTVTLSHLQLHHDVLTIGVEFLIQKGGAVVASASNLDIHHLLQCPGWVSAEENERQWVRVVGC